MKAIWIGFVCICMVTASPLKLDLTQLEAAIRNDNPGFIEGILLDLIDDVRDIILNGNDEIPVLDPLYIEELTLNDEILPLPGAHIHLEDTTVKNLGSFIIDDLSVAVWLIINNINLAGHIPVIEVENGKYDLSVSAAGFHVFGSGSANMKIINPSITAYLQIQIGLSGMSLSQCDVKFNLGGFEPEISGLFGHDGASDFVNLFLKDFVPELLKLYEDDINEVLTGIVRDIVSDALP